MTKKMLSSIKVNSQIFTTFITIFLYTIFGTIANAQQKTDDYKDSVDLDFKIRLWVAADFSPDFIDKEEFESRIYQFKIEKIECKPKRVELFFFRIIGETIYTCEKEEVPSEYIVGVSGEGTNTKLYRLKGFVDNDFPFYLHSKTIVIHNRHRNKKDIYFRTGFVEVQGLDLEELYKAYKYYQRHKKVKYFECLESNRLKTTSPYRTCKKNANEKKHKKYIMARMSWSLPFYHGGAFVKIKKLKPDYRLF